MEKEPQKIKVVVEVDNSQLDETKEKAVETAAALKEVRELLQSLGRLE